MRFISLCLALLCLALSPLRAAAQPAAAPLTAEDLDAFFDGYFPHALEQGDIAGAVVVVVKDGQVLFKKGYGYADVRRRIPMDPDATVIGVGSISKLFTWTAVMQQAEQGKLDLDVDINRYLDFRIPPAFGKPITLRHLMTHSAGFEERAFRLAPDGTQARDLKAYLKGTPVPARIYPPGTTPAYSNYGSMLAGYIVERVSGEPFVDYVQRHILDPLGMAHSTFARPIPRRLEGALSQSYELASSGEPNPIENEEPRGDPSGHLNTTATDMARFMTAHLQQGRLGDFALLRPDTTERMHTVSFKPAPLVYGTALGFFRMDRNGRRVIGHAGDITGFHASLDLLPAEGVGVFVGLNSDGVASGLLSASNAVRWSLSHQFMDRYYPASPKPELPTAPTAKAHAALAAGEYHISQAPSGDFQEAVMLATQYLALKDVITANPDGTITTAGLFKFVTGRPQTWREVGPFVWREVGGDDELHMKVENGEVVAFSNADILPAFISLRTDPARSAALNMPPIIAAVVVLLLAVLLWPVTALVRRWYGPKVELSAREARARLAANLAALLGVVYLVGWVMVLGQLSKLGVEPWIRLVQGIGLLCIPGAALAIWNAGLTIRGRRPWWSKAWSVLIALALVELVWFSFAFHLISTSLNF